MDRKQIIMNYSVPPSLEDMEVIAAAVFESLPDEVLSFCEAMTVQIEEFPDEALEMELDIEDPYELLAFFKSGKEISPGIEKKEAQEDDVLILFRRPILDAWCEREEDLAGLIRQVMIEEVGAYFDLPDEEVEELSERHYQGML